MPCGVFKSRVMGALSVSLFCNLRFVLRTLNLDFVKWDTTFFLGGVKGVSNLSED